MKETIILFKLVFGETVDSGLWVVCMHQTSWSAIFMFVILFNNEPGEDKLQCRQEWSQDTAKDPKNVKNKYNISLVITEYGAVLHCCCLYFKHFIKMFIDIQPLQSYTKPRNM